jgi:hypothetical protein
MNSSTGLREGGDDGDGRKGCGGKDDAEAARTTVYNDILLKIMSNETLTQQTRSPRAAVVLKDSYSLPAAIMHHGGSDLTTSVMANRHGIFNPL